MRLVFHNGVASLGDDLNKYLFPRLFPDLPWTNGDDTQFVGMGSILDERLNHTGKSIVFGSGARSREQLPDFSLGEWDISFVRGPLTAKAIGGHYITDAAYAFALLDPRVVCKKTCVAFIPHFTTATQDGAVWKEVCAELDILYVDPRAPLDVVIRQISGSHLVITEAMYGAIFADMNRVQWISVRALAGILQGEENTFKWMDWTGSIGLDWDPVQLPIFWPGRGPVSQAKHITKFHIAKRCLQKLCDAPSQLSSDTVFQSKMDQIVEKVEDVRERYSAIIDE